MSAPRTTPASSAAGAIVAGIAVGDWRSEVVAEIAVAETMKAGAAGQQHRTALIERSVDSDSWQPCRAAGAA